MISSGVRCRSAEALTPYRRVQENSQASECHTERFGNLHFPANLQTGAGWFPPRQWRIRKGTIQPHQAVFPVGAVNNQLTNQAVVKGRYRIAGIYRAVHAHTKATGG